jgi:hypothetical protein
MNLKQLVDKAKDKDNFADLKAYIKFCDEYLNYISDNLQAIIVSQNENHYQFYQYKKEGNFQITRPINSNLMYNAEDFAKTSKEFLRILRTIKTIDKKDDVLAQDLSFAGLLRRCDVKKSRVALQPIFEAFTNALDAIEIREKIDQDFNGKIEIKIYAQETTIENATDFHKLSITDNGIGFNNVEVQWI